MSIEVAYARPDRQLVMSVEVPIDTPAVNAIESSGILDEFPEIDLAKSKIGVFGKLINPDQVLQPGDRVEIYRPLLADPREVRRQLAALGKSIGKNRDRDS